MGLEMFSYPVKGPIRSADPSRRAALAPHEIGQNKGWSHIVLSIKYLSDPQVTRVIRSNRLRWLDHIWRSPENKQTRAYTFKNPMGSRTRGRPSTRWI
ncbi:hypothetical protein TNCV_2964541 [Trichonephila clavipes]|nr:hypothetical protein TNCV_2964541 [Trichonephila clavipes]